MANTPMVSACCHFMAQAGAAEQSAGLERQPHGQPGVGDVQHPENRFTASSEAAPAAEPEHVRQRRDRRQRAAQCGIRREYVGYRDRNHCTDDREFERASRDRADRFTTLRALRSR